MLKIDKLTKRNLRDYMTEDGDLYLLIASTHSGYINGNYVAYLPARTPKDAGTFVSPYNKPVLMHHDSHRDAVGRNIAAMSVDMVPKSGADPNKVARRRRSLKSEAEDLAEYLYSLGDGAYDYRNSLRAIMTVVKVSDPDVVNKIADGRIRTVSIGASSSHLFCSICGTDWAVDGMCPHWPGEEDEEGRRMFFIAGPLTYDEQSFVNIPADPGAQIVAVLTEEEVNQKTYEEIAMQTMKDAVNGGEVKLQDQLSNDTTAAEDSQTQEPEVVEESQDAALDAEALEALKAENAALTEKLEAADNKVADLTAKLDAANALVDELTQEVKRSLLVTLADALGKLGKRNDSEFIQERFGEKTLQQIRDYLDVLTMEDADTPANETVDADAPEGESGETSLQDGLESVNAQPPVETDNQHEVIIPAHIQRKALQIANTKGVKAAQEFINDYKAKQTQTGDAE